MQILKSLVVIEYLVKRFVQIGIMKVVVVVVAVVEVVEWQLVVVVDIFVVASVVQDLDVELGFVVQVLELVEYKIVELEHQVVELEQRLVVGFEYFVVVEVAYVVVVAADELEVEHNKLQVDLGSHMMMNFYHFSLILYLNGFLYALLIHHFC